MNEFIPEELEIPQLDQLGRQLANEVARLSRILANYEAEVSNRAKAYKLELAKAKVLLKDSKYSPTMVNAIADTTPEVMAAAEILQQAEALLLVGKAELEGRDKQYTMVKKIIDLRVQELRVFKG